ncbi:UvrD-helicase domain-containing protein [Sporosarcina sp. GW1-11]|uniref:UvrD-helicase domain-containing protein n=1 Tax=Sporosarcina sp. GW1-11 TaxID=2899126 RepID=UPI00294FBB9D|nr:UvrD-helicase domain-containing protein [Sporosarcina sp. GW1-11]MDV6376973.1 UvrD-helicase domain-containing protein [Sporosarcina sp. GW1-11]
MKQYYSCIIFRSDITEETIEELRSLIKNGTKCYFFSYDLTDKIEDDELLNEALHAQMLFVYETMFTESLQNNFTFFNGIITPDIFETLTVHTPLFNHDQFLIEHAQINTNISVSAGAGTGKTTVMINRILFLKYMIPELDLSQVVLITFTNKAALHMRSKLVEKLKSYFHFTKNHQYLQWLLELKKMEIGTIHSFAHTLLQKNEESGYGSAKLPISQFVYRRRKIIEQVLDEYHQEQPKIFDRFKYIEQYKLIQITEAIMNRLNHYSIPTSQIEKLDFGGSDDSSHEMFKYIVTKSAVKFSEFKESKEVLDVTDLIVNLNSLMKRRDRLVIPYQYIFIDEFQDTDEQQTKFLSFLGKSYPLHIFIVGDVKQSIYRFRGADYTAIKQMEKELVMDHKFSLQMNYRSDGALLDKFNQLFSTWPDKVRNFRYEKKDRLYPGRQQEELVTDEPFVNIDVKSIHRYLEFLKSCEGTDTAVLVRTNREVNELSLLCEQNKIFYSSEKDGDFYRSLVVREFYQLIMRFVHPSNWKNRYTLHFSSYGDRLLTTDDTIEHFLSNKRKDSLLADVDKKFVAYEEKFRHQNIFKVLNEIIQEINPAQIYMKRFLQERLLTERQSEELVQLAEFARREYMLNLNHLIYLMKKEMKDGISTLNQLESILRIKMQTDKTETYQRIDELEDKRLKIMTVHKSKGLEFDYVVLPNTSKQINHFIALEILYDQGKIGYQAYDEKGKTFTNNLYDELKRDDSQENIGEEARLLYVAMTRAKKRVYYDAPEFTNNHEIRKWGDLIAADHRRRANFQTSF